MKTKQNSDLYAEYSQSFISGLRTWIEESVSETKLKKTAREELVDSLLWNMCCLLDGSANLEHSSDTLIPVVGFQHGTKPTVVFDDDDGVPFHELLDAEDDE